MPDYPFVEKKFNYYIDRNFMKNLNSKICGWAYFENDDCDVYMEANNRIYKSKATQRLDVKEHFKIDRENIGFEFFINPIVKNFKIILENKDKKEIYMS